MTRLLDQCSKEGTKQKHNKPINDVNSISLNAFDEVNDVGLSDVTLGATQNLLQGRTRNQDKLSVLLLIACLSQFILYLLGLAVKAADKHRQYQANSIKHRNVLTNQFIGLRAYKDRNLKLLKSHWQLAIKMLQGLVREPQASY